MLKKKSYTIIWYVEEKISNYRGLGKNYYLKITEKVMSVSTFQQIVEFIINFGSITNWGAMPLNSGYLLVAPIFNG